MWKWTDANNIKAIILDMNSLNQDYFDYPFESSIKNVKVFKVKYFWNDKIEKTKDILEYFDLFSLLQEVLTKAKCESYSLIAISSDFMFLKGMMQNHIGTILAGNLTSNFLKSTPDFTDNSINTLNQILKKEKMGYGADLVATYNRACKNMSLLKSKSLVKLDNGQDKILNLYFGGRYYSYKHQYLLDDPLSIVIKEFKKRYVRIVDLFFDLVIGFLNRKEEIDMITSIPLKPIDIMNNKFDRFSSLHLKECSGAGLKHQNILICKKNFSQKGNDLFNRKEIVKGAFDVVKNVEGKNIVLIDDVYSSGSTFLEASKTLYEAGAKNVIGVLLAINQMTESSSASYHNITCPFCGEPMVLRINHDTKQMFFGCTAYQTHPQIDTSIPLQEGLQILKYINRLEVTEIIDLNDEY